MLRYLALATTLALAACQSAKASTNDDVGLCTQVFYRARACTDTYIPALVDSL